MSAKRLLFGVLWPSPGGHTRTALALAEVLRARHHQIEFLVDATATSTTLLAEAGFRVHRIQSLGGAGLFGSFERQLEALVRTGGCDAIHWFEKAARVRGAASVAAKTGQAFVWTVTSGGPPIGYHGLSRMVVFTNEVAEHARQKAPGAVVHVLPARVSWGEVTAALDPASRSRIRTRLRIPDAAFLIVRVARCAKVYVHSIRLGIALTERLHREGWPAMFVHAGFVNEPEAADEIRTLVDAANRRVGRTIVFTVTDDVPGVKYMAAGDLCIGSGRSALEALAIERPTLVMWGSHYLGLVDPGNIQELADTNFQGRQAPAVTSDDDSVAHMHLAVRGRLADPDRARRDQAACSQFVRECYSVESAADAYETLYDDRTVTLEGPASYYSNPRHLANELRWWIPLSLRRLVKVSGLKSEG